MTHRTVSGKRWVNHRASGMVCHVSSLPGPFGIGDLGAESRRFVDFLADADQTLWQILPLGPTGYGESPYMSTSAFGGNPLLIDPAALVEAGWLEPFELAHLPDFDAQRVDYVRAKSFKLPLLEKAYQRFARRPGAVAAAEFRRFCRRNAAWLNDYALFAALKEAHDFTAWSRWTPSIAQRRPAALAEWRARLSDRIALQKFAQWVFHQQWEALRDYCHQRGVEVIGDIPMYVAYDSADVWAHQDYFRLDAKGEPRLVAGVPPDYFSATGQRWGNPIYCWSRMRKDGYRWWIDRFRAEFAKCDILRIDHFRGFEAYWEIPARESTAVRGRWVQGPGARFFQVVRMALAEAGIPMRIIAEDLGLITAKVDALRDRLGFPGMRVLQVAFGNDGKSPAYQPHNYVPNCVVYTATHDHNTTVGWFTAEPGTQTTQSPGEVRAERELAMRYCHSDGREIHWDFIRAALSSVAAGALFPVQDVLGLGTQARMNRPGQASGNWEWRFTWDQLTADLGARLSELTRLYGRGPAPETRARPRTRRKASPVRCAAS